MSGPGAYHLLAFQPGADGDVLIDTTRPELLVSCVALVAHPDDERYAGLVGSTVRTPIFDVEVPVVAHPLAQPDKGTGIAMVCTFGDTTDVTWWRELDLPTRSVIGRDGRFLAVHAGVADRRRRPARRTPALAGLTVKQAQTATVEQLRASGDLRGDPRPITHPVKFYERGSRPLEIVTSRQWYIRNGGRDQDRRDAFLTRGKELAWFPDHMRHRYEHWVEGLNGDWLISRQRFFGVPIPLWYPVGDDGEPDHDHPIVPAEDTLPMDPSAEAPPGYTEDQRGRPGGFVGDADIMDTWATSSLTPQIAGRWVDDPDLFARVFPMDLRPQGPEIIRTWLFSTVVRAHYEHGTLPWANTTINGWILDPDRKKMSKSKGNVVTPMALFDQYGTDAVRYWAVSARPGVDTAFSEDQMKVGRRLATKLLNVTKFVLGMASASGARRRRRRDRPRSTWPCWPASTRPSPRPRWPSRASTTPGPWSAPRRSSGGSATTTSSSSRAAPTAAGATGRRRRPTPRCAGPSRRCSGCWPRRCPTPPRRRGAGRTTTASTPPSWPASRADGVGVRPRRSMPSARCSGGCGGPRPRPSRASGPPSPGSSSAPRAPSARPIEAAAADLADALTVTELVVVDGDGLGRGRRAGRAEPTVRDAGSAGHERGPPVDCSAHGRRRIDVGPSGAGPGASGWPSAPPSSPPSSAS